MGFPLLGVEEGDVGLAAEARLDHVGHVAVPVDADLLDHPAEVAKAALDGMLGEHDRLIQRGHQPLGRVETEPGGEGSVADEADPFRMRSEEHTSELQSLMRISYAVFCLKKKKQQQPKN